MSISQNPEGRPHDAKKTQAGDQTMTDNSEQSHAKDSPAQDALAADPIESRQQAALFRELQEQFRRACLTGQIPKIDEYLRLVPQQVRPQLRAKLLWLQRSTTPAQDQTPQDQTPQDQTPQDQRPQDQTPGLDPSSDGQGGLVSPTLDAILSAGLPPASEPTQLSPNPRSQEATWENSVGSSVLDNTLAELEPEIPPGQPGATMASEDSLPDWNDDPGMTVAEDPDNAWPDALLGQGDDRSGQAEGPSRSTLRGSHAATHDFSVDELADAPAVEQDAGEGQSGLLPSSQAQFNSGTTGQASSHDSADRSGGSSGSSLGSGSASGSAGFSGTGSSVGSGSQVGSQDSQNWTNDLADQTSDERLVPQETCGPEFEGAPRYELVEELAQGGLGRVWHGYDRQLCRDVAVKDILPGKETKTVLVERFFQEAQITGQLEHPGIVPVHELGRKPDGGPFYAMKLLGGRTLEDAIEELHALPANHPDRSTFMAELIRLFIGVCQALAYAHNRGVIHRDLKPANIMLGDYGEAIVVDWGLAKVIEEPDDSAWGERSGDLELSDPDSVNVLDDPSVASGSRSGLSSSSSARGASGHPGNSSGSRSSASSEGSHAGSQSGSRFSASQSGSIRTRSSLQGSSSSVGGSAFLSSLSATGKSRRRHRVHGSSFRSSKHQTAAGSLMGTPAFMSPEQAQGLVEQLDARSDIYALGSVLYQLVTGQAPYDGESAWAIIKKVAQNQLTAPRAVDSSISRPLEAIILKAMNLAPEDRYQTADELGRELVRWLSGEPVLAYPEPWSVRTGRWIRKHPALCTSATVVVVLALVQWVGWQSWRSSHLESLRGQALALMQQAAEEETPSVQGRKLLEQAADLLAFERPLAQLHQEAQRRLQELDQQQALQRTREQLNPQLLAAQEEFSAGRLEQARLQFTTILAATEDQTGLEDLQSVANERLQLINEQLFRLENQAQTRQRLNKFRTFRDQALFHGTLLTGLNRQKNFQLCQDAAIEALKLFAGENQEDSAGRKQDSAGQKQDVSEQAGPQADVTQRNLWLPPPAEFAPRYLEPAEQIEVREGCRELLFVMADAVALKATTRATGTPSGELTQFQEARLQHALALLERTQGKPFGKPLHSYYKRKARLLQRLGQTREAAQALEAAKSTPPRGSVDYFLVGDTLLKEGKIQKASDQFLLALRDDPGHFWSQYFLAVCQVQLENYNAAVASLTACLSQRKDFAWVLLLRGYAHANLGHYAEAEADFLEAERLDADNYGLYLMRGAMWLARKDLTQAAADFQQAIQRNQQAFRGYLNLANVYHQEKDPRKELKLLAEAAERSPKEPLVFLQRAKVYQDLGEPNSALVDLEKALELGLGDDNKADAQFRRGNLLRALRRPPAEALAAYDAAIKIDPDNRDYRLARANLLATAGQADAAEAALTELVKREQPQPDTFRLRGVQRARQGKVEEAFTDYTLALALDADPDALTFARRGWAVLNHGAKVAEKDFDQALQLNPRDSDLYIGRGFARVRLGRYLEGVADAQKAVEIGPDPKHPTQKLSLPFNVACLYAQALAQVQMEPPSRQSQSLQRSYRQAAFESLGNALKLVSPKMRQQLLKDPALLPLRADSQFSRLLGPR